MKTLILAMAMAPLLFGISSMRAGTQEPFRQISFEKACTLAKASKKQIMIDFYTEWCGPCKKLDQTTWKDAKVQTWLSSRLVCLKVDAEKNVKLASKYKVNAYPTILFLRPDGSEIDRIVGYLEPQDFLSSAKDALAGRDALSRAKDKLAGANKNDPGMREDYGNALKAKGKYKEALQEYLWCFDIGMKKSSEYYGVRLSFLVKEIAILGSIYPEALFELKKRRDKAAEAITKGMANEELEDEFFSYNWAMDENDLNLKLFDAMREKRPEFAKRYFHDVSDMLIGAKRYEDFVKYGGDLNSQVEESLGRYLEEIKAIGKSEEGSKLLMKNFAVEGACKPFQVLCGVKREAEAEAFFIKILAFDSRTETFEVLIQNAKRANDDGIVKKLLDRAEKTLKPDEYLKLKKSANSTL